MVKKILPLFIFLLPLWAGPAQEEKKLPEFFTPHRYTELSYGFLAKGLKQFPLMDIRFRTAPLYTIIGNSYANGELSLRLVGADEKISTITIMGREVSLGLLMHKVKPFVGKYRFWDPVITLTAKSPDEKYFWYEIVLMGRFLIEWDKKVTNKINGYQNEIFP